MKKLHKNVTQQALFSRQKVLAPLLLFFFALDQARVAPSDFSRRVFVLFSASSRFRHFRQDEDLIFLSKALWHLRNCK